MRRFLRTPARTRDPLIITMSGVRMGERVLQIGVNDPRLAGVVAAKVGLSGQAAIAVPDERSAERARHGAVEAGVLLDVHVTPLHTLPFEAEAFDAIIVNGVDGLMAALNADSRERFLRECFRVLRQGGRIIAIEAGRRGGLTALLRPRQTADRTYEGGGGTSGAFVAAGFKAVRILTEREGCRFTEGLKSK